ncbi:cyclin N-terminal domain-containing protein 1-like isoform X1 [Saccostrea echinata]|uniref:cyclin N-terminal domain-containing protein 1-like isoform X1 n=1 Tax=Saccostrea echinata TaxID=191078 RepID=UPI002A81C8B1|nr:cyclin N-terminal domain-containing protein 1-like isoform X1 [Saccostrea echinata]
MEGEIFASPIEPLFNHEHALETHILQDWLINLAKKNFRHINQAHSKQGLFKQVNAVETIMYAAEKLKIAQEAKYLAIELFDRFLYNHLQDLRDHVLKLPKKRQMKEWSSLQEGVSNQVLLRIVSCCQIASKLTSHYKAFLFQVVSVNRAKRFLCTCGYRYASESLLQSELRVLKTLKFQVTEPTPIVFIETLLEILGCNNTKAEVKTFYYVALKLLDLLYLKYHTFYKILFEVISSSKIHSKEQKREFSKVKADQLLLATAVISCSVYMVQEDKADEMIKELNRITRISKNDIEDFASVLIQLVEEE